jgi:hypothetical protein
VIRPDSRWGWVILGLVLVPVSQAADPVVLTPRWKVGDKARYEMVKTRERVATGKPAPKVTSRTEITVEVVRATKDGYAVAWGYGAATVEGRAGNDPAVVAMANLLKGQRVVLDIDPDGDLRGVENWRELKGLSDKMVARLTDDLAGRFDKEAVAKLTDQARRMFASKEAVEQAWTREPGLFFAAVGLQFDDTKVIEYEDHLPNPLGGPAFPSKARFVLKGVDANAGIARVTWSQTLDPAEAAKIIERTIKGLTLQLGKSPPDAAQFKNIVIEDTAEIAIRTATGWVDGLTHTRTVTVGGDRQIDTVTLTRK